jgi:hypothetical protein
MTNEKPKEDILKRAKRTLEESKAKAAAQAPAAPPANVNEKPEGPVSETAPAARPADLHATLLGNIVQEMTTGDVTVQKAKTGYTNIKNAWRWLTSTKPVRAYKWLLDKTDAKKYANRFAKKLARVARIGVYLWTAATAAQVGRLLPDSMGGNIVTPAADAMSYVTYEPAYDATRMAAYGVHKERVCLTNYTEIDHSKGEYSVSGNKIGQPANEENALYYMLKPSLMHTFWQVSKGRFSAFDPNLVTGPILDSGSHEYEVTSYGHRWRIGGPLQAYPYMLDVQRLPDRPGVCFNAASGSNGSDEQAQPAPAPTGTQITKTPTPQH